VKKQFNLLSDYKIGWWKKGNVYRYCYGFGWFGMQPMVKYRSKYAHLSGSKKMTAVNPATDKWFPQAEYLGLELEELDE